MLIRIRLGDQDRTELGLESEWIEVDPHRLMLSEAEVLDAAGIDWMRERQGRPVLDENGERRRDPNTGIELASYGPGVQRVWVWLGLRRAGMNVELQELDFDLNAVVIRVPEPPSPGKDAAAASPTSGAATRRSSGTSTRRSRAKK